MSQNVTLFKKHEVSGVVLLKLVKFGGNGDVRINCKDGDVTAVIVGWPTDRCAKKVTTAPHLVLDFQQNLCKEGNLLCAAVSNHSWSLESRAARTVSTGLGCTSRKHWSARQPET